MTKKITKIIVSLLLIMSITFMNFTAMAESNDNSNINDNERIKNEIDNLRDYYEDDDSYSFREAITLNYTSDDLDKDIHEISDRFELLKGDSATNYAANIIGIIASGKNPEDYEGVNYVKLLLDSQDESGKFIIVSGDKHPATLSWCIMALDLAKADYDVKKAVKALLEMQDKDGAFTRGKEVDTTAMAVTALAKHKDIDEVEDAIYKSLEYIKNLQLDSGGFAFMGTDNPYSLCTVIQALIANKIEPLSNKWSKNGNTLLDALLSFKVDDHFEYKTKWGSEKKSATEQSFLALADLYRGKSMYQNLKIYKYPDDGDDKEKNKEKLDLHRKGDERFRRGEEAKIEISVENNTSEDKEVTLILVLYEEDDEEMVNYTYLTKEVKVDEEEVLSAGFLIPKSGDYEVKAFLWDNLEDMNILTDPIIVDVK